MIIHQFMKFYFGRKYVHHTSLYHHSKLPCYYCQVSKWILNSQENNGILVVTTLPSGNWMDSLTDTNTYLVIFSDDGRIGPTNQSYFGKLIYLSS